MDLSPSLHVFLWEICNHSNPSSSIGIALFYCWLSWLLSTCLLVFSFQGFLNYDVSEFLQVNPVWGSHSLWICRCLSFSKIRKFSTISSLNIFSAPTTLFLLPSETLMTWMLNMLLSQRSLRLYSFFSTLYFVHCWD